MIHFIHSRSHAFELQQVKKTPLAPATRMMDYDRLFKKSGLPFSTYIFTDLERLGFWDLELAGQGFAELQKAGLKVLNNPARAKNRFNLLRSLHDAGLNDFNVYRAEALPATMRFPVFLRKLLDHTRALSGLLDNREDLDMAIANAVASGIPFTNLLVVEYVGEPVREGLFRKIAAFRVGEKIVPYICGHDTHWYVKTGQTGIAGEELYRKELELIERNPHAEHLKKVFDLAEIQFGRADYGFYKGRIQIFEINTNPLLEEFSPHPSPLREQSMRLTWEKIMAALHEIDSGSGANVKFKKDRRMRRYRKWSLGNLFTRAREVD